MHNEVKLIVLENYLKYDERDQLKNRYTSILKCLINIPAFFDTPDLIATPCLSSLEKMKIFTNSLFYIISLLVLYIPTFEDKKECFKRLNSRFKTFEAFHVL